MTIEHKELKVSIYENIMQQIEELRENYTDADVVVLGTRVYMNLIAEFKIQSPGIRVESFLLPNITIVVIPDNPDLIKVGVSGLNPNVYRFVERDLKEEITTYYPEIEHKTKIED